MKTVKVIPTSSNPVTLSKATKFLSQFVSVENGSSQAISAYLRRTFAACNELNQLHKHIRNPHSESKHRRNKSDVDSENNAVENETVQFRDKRGKHQKLIKEEEEEDQTHGVPRSGQGFNPSLSTNMVVEDGIEKHKGKKKLDFESKNYGDHEGDMKNQDELKPAFRESAEKKHRKDKRRNKKGKTSNDEIDGSGQVPIIRVKHENHKMEIEDASEYDKKHNKSGMENRIVEEKVKKEEKKKRKKDDMEDKQEDGSSQLHSKKKRRMKSEDDI